MVYTGAVCVSDIKLGGFSNQGTYFTPVLSSKSAFAANQRYFLFSVSSPRFVCLSVSVSTCFSVQYPSIFSSACINLHSLFPYFSYTFFVPDLAHRKLACILCTIIHTVILHSVRDVATVTGDLRSPIGQSKPLIDRPVGRLYFRTS